MQILLKKDNSNDLLKSLNYNNQDSNYLCLQQNKTKKRM